MQCIASATCSSLCSGEFVDLEECQKNTQNHLNSLQVYRTDLDEGQLITARLGLFNSTAGKICDLHRRILGLSWSSSGTKCTIFHKKRKARRYGLSYNQSKHLYETEHRLLRIGTGTSLFLFQGKLFLFPIAISNFILLLKEV